MPRPPKTIEETDPQAGTDQLNAPRKTRRPGRAKELTAPDLPGQVIEVSEDEQERTRLLPNGTEIYDARVEVTYKDGSKLVGWRPYGKTVPVLLIKYPRSFKPEHENALRNEPHVEEKRDKKIRNALKRHDEGGEIYFEMGRTEDEQDAMIDHGIYVLSLYGVEAVRELRFTHFLSRSEW